MTHEFEKYFPLPFVYGQGRIFIESEVTIQERREVADTADPQKFGLSQLKAFKVQDELGCYLVNCANLMPEVVRVLDDIVPRIDEVVGNHPLVELRKKLKEAGI